MGDVKALTHLISSALLLQVAFAADVAGALPAGSSVKVSPGTGNAFARLDMTDTGNRVWTLQSSPDLVTWTDVSPLSVPCQRSRTGPTFPTG